MLLSLAASVGLGFYLNREIVWDEPTVLGIIKKYLLIGTLIGLIGFALTRTARASISLTSFFFSKFREQLTGVRPQTPLEKLQEQFDAAYPGRLKKEDPPIPVIPPPNEDNPYSYR